MIVKIKELIDIPSIRYTFMSLIASGINFITLIIWGRVFPVEDYGIATTLQAFVSNASTFMIPLQVMICTLLANDSGYERRNVESIVSIFGFISIIELVLMFMVIEKVMHYLYFTKSVEVLLFIGLIIVNNIYTVLIGLAQGKQDFLLLGKTSIILYFIKLVVSVLLGIFGIGSLAVIIGFAIAEIVCVVIMLKKLIWLIRIPWNIYKFQIERDILKQYVWIFILYVVVSLYMNNGDLLLGNMYSSKVELGLYSATIGLSKISVFLVATPIATIVLPRMAAAKARREQDRMLMLAEIITFGGSLLYGICFYVLGGWFITFIYGEAYNGAVLYILPCVIFSTVLGMFWVFYQYILAIDLTKRFAVVTVIIGILAFGWILIVKGNLSSIPIIMAIAMILTIMSVVISRRKPFGGGK